MLLHPREGSVLWHLPGYCCWLLPVKSSLWGQAAKEGSVRPHLCHNAEILFWIGSAHCRKADFSPLTSPSWHRRAVSGHWHWTHFGWCWPGRVAGACLLCPDGSGHCPQDPAGADLSRTSKAQTGGPSAPTPLLCRTLSTRLCPIMLLMFLWLVVAVADCSVCVYIYISQLNTCRLQRFRGLASNRDRGKTVLVWTTGKNCML